MNEDEFNGFYDHLTAPSRKRVIRERVNYMELLDDTEFRIQFRLPKEAVNFVLSLIQDDISTITKRNNAVEPLIALLITLRYYATGNGLAVLEEFSGVSKATASRFVNLCSHAIASLRPRFVKFPVDTRPIQLEFYNIAKFPRLIGAIDTMHVPIGCPGGDSAEEFRNQKSQFSLKVQTVVNAKLKIMDIVARWPGATTNQTIFDNSVLKQRFEKGEFSKRMIVGDKGYQNTAYLLTPLQNPSTLAEFVYNDSQKRSRYVVEQACNVWTNRFPVLTKKILLHVSRTQAVIVACAMLHNIAIDYEDEHFNDSQCHENYHTMEEEDYCIPPQAQDESARNNLIREYFGSSYFENLSLRVKTS